MYIVVCLHIDMNLLSEWLFDLFNLKYLCANVNYYLTVLATQDQIKCILLAAAIPKTKNKKWSRTNKTYLDQNILLYFHCLM